MMKSIRGVIHIGAHFGQERDLYESYGLNVLWVEPIPAVFRELQRNISRLPKQRALNYLVLDQDGKKATLNISSNEAGSSSVLDWAKGRDIWPSITFEERIELTGYKIDTIMAQNSVELALYDAAVLDTQGSELMILRGARDTLRGLRAIQVEVADFEAYKDCPRPHEIAAELSSLGFREWRRIPLAVHPEGGRYYDIIYRR